MPVHITSREETPFTALSPERTDSVQMMSFIRRTTSAYDSPPAPG